MTQWEYLVVFIRDTDLEAAHPEADTYADADAFTDRLNSYGKAGWELVSFDWVDKGAKAAFKRVVISNE